MPPLNFNDEQIREITGQVLEAPDLIARANEEKAAVLKKQQDYKDLDDAQAVYTGYYNNIITKYHAELAVLSGTQRTNPNDALIDPAAQLAEGNVYLPRGEPVWKPFQPKLNDINNGNPTSVYPGTTEPAQIGLVTTSINLLKSGFTDGSASTTTTGAFTGSNVPVSSNAGFSVGNRVLFISGSNFLYGTITNITSGANPSPPPATIYTFTISVISSSAGTGGIGTGATVRNYHPGFTLAQRETGSGLSAGELAYMNGLKADIDTKVAAWETMLNTQLGYLNANDAPAPDAAEITAAKGDINNAKTIIDTWQAYPSTGSGTSRFGTNLPALESELSARPSFITARAPQITSRLGSVSQNGDGNFTGSGHYLNYFNNLNMRINMIQGTLRNYYQMNLGTEVFNQKIKVLEDQLAQGASTFTIAAFTADGDNGNTVAVKTTTGLGLGDTVKVMSNTVRTLTGTILAINDLRVTVSFDVPNTYTVGDKARLVKQN